LVAIGPFDLLLQPVNPDPSPLLIAVLVVMPSNPGPASQFVNLDHLANVLISSLNRVKVGVLY
jgi:hypothetical protein